MDNGAHPTAVPPGREPATVPTALFPVIIRDGRPGLPAAATFSGAVTAKPVGDTTGGHSNGTPLAGQGEHGRTAATAEGIDAFFAALPPLASRSDEP
jgi:hypothetical protein